jgi:CheY-like chemotaxis protein
MSRLRDRHGVRGIALSGYGMEDDMRQSREAGFVDHVVKPVDVAHLEAVLRRVIGGGV